ncbi:MAG: SH3 domain-containing protein [Verrucomicrobiales bacterium]|nr:SH3 domain-containing protein [Verrucomicrobiota bacterium JB025]
MAIFRANSDYEESDSDLIRLRAGDEVTVGHEDQAWPGWVWATDEHGNDGYVPEEILTLVGFGSYEAGEDFNPEVLRIRRGDRLVSLRHIHGWHWCRNEAGVEGWVAGYLMKPESPGGLEE